MFIGPSNQDGFFMSLWERWETIWEINGMQSIDIC